MSSAEVSNTPDDAPPSKGVFIIVLFIVGAIGFSPWVMAKYARENPTPAKASRQTSPLSNPAGGLSQRAMTALQLQHQRDYKAAIEQFTILINTSNQNKALNYGARGRCQLNLGKYGSAISDFNKSLAIDPTDADTYEDRATAYHRAGREAECAADLALARKYRK